MSVELFSVRMRAAEGASHEAGGKHISGGEGLCTREQVSLRTEQLLQKALNHSRGNSDFIQFTIEKLQLQQQQHILPLPLYSTEACNIAEGRERAKEYLQKAKIALPAIKKALAFLASTPNMRGAIVMDGETGERLDHRGQKGIRVSRMDWDLNFYEKWRRSHATLSSPRIAEAIALAAKVVNSKDTLAELCWSDDPEYTTGYVAYKQGYIRIPNLKEFGCESGGRVFFINRNNTDLESYIGYLEREPLWIGEEIGHE